MWSQICFDADGAPVSPACGPLFHLTQLLQASCRDGCDEAVSDDFDPSRAPICPWPAALLASRLVDADQIHPLEQYDL